MFLSVRSEFAQVLEWSEKEREYSVPRQIRITDIVESDILVTHFYGLDELHFQGLRAAYSAWRWKLPYLRLALLRRRQRLAQWLFNRRGLLASARLTVLRDTVAAVHLSAEEAIDSFDLMTKRFGNHWAGHPGWKQHQRLLHQQLQGLVLTGELKLAGDGHRFIPTGLAFKTIGDADDTDRKHRDNFRLQMIIIGLTLGSTIIGAIQAGVVKVPTLLDLTAR